MTTMPAPDAAKARSPLELALERVGDRWSLLVVEALLDGPRRFNELQDGVSAVSEELAHGGLVVVLLLGVDLGDVPIELDVLRVGEAVVVPAPCIEVDHGDHANRPTLVGTSSLMSRSRSPW